MASPYSPRLRQATSEANLRHRPQHLTTPLSPTGLPQSPRPVQNLLTPTTTSSDGLTPLSNRFEQLSPALPEVHTMPSQDHQERGRQPQRPDPFSYVIPLSPSRSRAGSFSKEKEKQRAAIVRFGRRMLNACFGPSTRKQPFEVERIESCHWTEI